MDAKETITYLYSHGHIPKCGHYQTVILELEQLQAKLSDLETDKEILVECNADLVDKCNKLQAENTKLRKCLIAEWDGRAVDKILTDTEELQAENVLLKERIEQLQAELKKYKKDRTKNEIQALIEKYGDPQYKTSEFALYDVISVAQQLLAELEKYRWVPVSERLPEHFKNLGHSLDVWLLCDGVSHKGYFAQLWHIYDSCEDVELYQHRVTHWMEIPKLPEEK